MSKRAVRAVTLFREFSTTPSCLARRRARTKFDDGELKVSKFQAKDWEPLIRTHFGRDNPEYEEKEARRESLVHRLSPTTSRQEQQARLQAALALKERRDAGSHDTYHSNSRSALVKHVKIQGNDSAAFASKTESWRDKLDTPSVRLDPSILLNLSPGFPAKTA